MTRKSIMDYFCDEVEYPNDVASNPLPMNVFYSYISSTFLNGFINYIEPIKIYVLNRYEDDKTELINNLPRQVHTKLSQFGDDIIILGRIRDEENRINKFMLFWFDMDVSDCCIGRFETNDNEEEVKKSLQNWLELCVLENKGVEFHPDLDNGILGFHELPKCFLEGWISF